MWEHDLWIKLKGTKDSWDVSSCTCTTLYFQEHVLVLKEHVEGKGNRAAGVVLVIGKVLFRYVILFVFYRKKSTVCPAETSLPKSRSEAEP